ncbi:MAG TPA: hypothetical protein VK914_10970 [bacterium]|jgi:hypothetical protein|nr:hypothetical protein [bacterium]
MRWTCLALIFLSSTAWAADTNSGQAPTASPQSLSPSATASTAQPVSPSAVAASPQAVSPSAVAASPQPLSSSATAASPQYLSPSAAAATPQASPAAVSESPAPGEAGPGPDVAHILDFQPSWGLGLRGGAALPIGGQTAADSLGSMEGLDFFYHATENSTIDVMGMYASMHDTVGAAIASPVSTFGLTVKLDYEVYRQEKTSALVGLGVGYMDVQGTKHTVNQPISNPVTYSESPENNAGLTLLGCVGLGYDITPQWSLNLELVLMSLDTDNGTSNNILAALPDVYVKWMY